MYMSMLNVQIPTDLCALIRAYGQENQKSTVQVVVAALSSYLAHFARLQRASREYDIQSAYNDYRAARDSKMSLSPDSEQEEELDKEVAELRRRSGLPERKRADPASRKMP